MTTIEEIEAKVERKDVAGIVDILLKEKDRWNDFMKQRDEINKSIQGVQKIPLRGVNLKGENLSGLKLNNVDFSESDVSDADFSGSTIVGSDFSGSNVSGADFGSAGISESDFSGSNAYKADFSGSYMTGSVIVGGAYDSNAAQYSGHRSDSWSYGEVDAAAEHHTSASAPNKPGWGHRQNTWWE